MEDLESRQIDEQIPDDQDATAEQDSHYDRALRTYLKEMGRLPRMSKKEEYDLGMRLKEVRDRAGELKRQIGEAEDPDEIANLKEELAPVQAEFDLIVNRLTTANLRLVVHIAKRYRNKGINFKDLIQEGNCGLRHAATKFDAEKASLSGYAGWWIKQTITRALADRGRTVRIPVFISDVIKKVSNFQRVFENINGRMPDEAEIVKGLELKPAKVKALLKYMRMRDTSIDAPVSEDGKLFFRDSLIDESDIDPTEKIMLDRKKEIIEGFLNELNPGQKTIIRKRYGYKCDHREADGLTLEQIGNQIHRTKERVRQVQAQAEKKLRWLGRVSGAKDDL